VKPALVGCMLDDADSLLLPKGFDEFVSLHKSSANARDKKRRTEISSQSIECPESWNRVRQLLGIAAPLPKLTFGELTLLVVFLSCLFSPLVFPIFPCIFRFVQVENESLNVASEYCLDMISMSTRRTTTMQLQHQHQCVVMFPIPAKSIINFGNASSSIISAVTRTSGYLCLGDLYALLQASGVVVKSADGSSLSFRDAVSKPDLFLPSKYY